MDKVAEILVNKAGQVYSLPMVYVQLSKVIDDPYCDLEDVAKIISEDAGICVRLLKIANSSMYNFPSKIETISRAITIIGTKQLRDLVLATCVIDMFKDISNDLVDMGSFWRHSIATGITARVIATYQRENNVERFYLMGLLHDLGRLLMFSEIPDQAKEVIESSVKNKQLIYQTEHELLGFDHSDVALLLLKSWQLPQSIVTAVGYHHKPSQAVEYKNETAVIHLSDIISNSLQLGSSGERYVVPLSDEAWQIINIKASLLPDILDRVESQYEGAIEVFLS